jgi:predicted GTPase
MLGYFESAVANYSVISFTGYVKNFKVDSKTISQKTIDMIELHLTKGNIQGANSIINDALKEIDATILNIAVTGECGSGKSSFINALRGVGHEGKTLAPIGVKDTAMNRTLYEHPNSPT